MKSFLRVASIAVTTVMVALAVTGCETSRMNKEHSPLWLVSDETTTGHQEDVFPADPKGQPPVPGSPTAAGPDGRQPYSDGDARSGAGAEHGMAAPPSEQPKDSFQRQ
jgi:hypothetical protein